LANLEVFGKKINSGSIFVVSESILPKKAHLFLESCPTPEV